MNIVKTKSATGGVCASTSRTAGAPRPKAQRSYDVAQHMHTAVTCSMSMLVLWAYSNPKWPVEWVSNWSIIPPSASTRGQNRPLRPPPGGGGPPSIYFRATGRLDTTTHCKSELPFHEHWLSIKTPNPKWPLARVASWPKMPQST